MDEAALRSEIIERCLEMNRNGINQGTSGNISARFEDGFLVTPTAPGRAASSPPASGASTSTSCARERT